MKFMYKLLTAVIVFTILSCTSVSGKLRAEQKLHIKKRKEVPAAELRIFESGDRPSELRSEFLPGIVFLGEIKEENNGLGYFITGARLFSNWPNGWTEAEYQASGKLYFTEKNGSWVCSVADSFEFWDIASGQIRFYDNFYRHDDGLMRAKNRIDRITETVRILKELNGKKFYNSINKKIDDQLSFRKDIKRILFPEKAKFKKLEKNKQLPAAYYENRHRFPEKKVFGSDYFWRSDYTRAVFPENIHKLRDSGTLWKDFDEAIFIFFSLYNLEYFFDNILDNNSFVKLK